MDYSMTLKPVHPVSTFDRRYGLQYDSKTCTPPLMYMYMHFCLKLVYQYSVSVMCYPLKIKFIIIINLTQYTESKYGDQFE